MWQLTSCTGLAWSTIFLLCWAFGGRYVMQWGKIRQYEATWSTMSTTNESGVCSAARSDMIVTITRNTFTITRNTLTIKRQTIPITRHILTITRHANNRKTHTHNHKTYIYKQRKDGCSAINVSRGVGAMPLRPHKIVSVTSTTAVQTINSPRGGTQYCRQHQPYIRLLSRISRLVQCSH